MLNILCVVILNHVIAHLLSLYTLYGCGSRYEWFVPMTWIKTGGVEQQYWLLDKEGKTYFT